jgi:hypothetical protein
MRSLELSLERVDDLGVLSLNEERGVPRMSRSPCVS